MRCRHKMARILGFMVLLLLAQAACNQDSSNAKAIETSTGECKQFTFSAGDLKDPDKMAEIENFFREQLGNLDAAEHVTVTTTIHHQNTFSTPFPTVKVNTPAPEGTSIPTYVPTSMAKEIPSTTAVETASKTTAVVTTIRQIETTKERHTTTASASTTGQGEMTTKAYVSTDKACYMGMKSGKIPDSAITASSIYNDDYAAHRGRLDLEKNGNLKGAWRADSDQIGEWIQVDFGEPKVVAGVITQGRFGWSFWVESYKVSCGNSVENLATITWNVAGKTFSGNFDKHTKVTNKFPQQMTCRYIRIYPQTWRLHISMRLELIGGDCYGPTTELKTIPQTTGQLISSEVPHVPTTNFDIEISCYLGMKSGKIPDSAITASSVYKEYFAHTGRLDRGGGWAPERKQIGQWIQVDFAESKLVAGVITQGRTDWHKYWVTSYKVSCGISVGNLTRITENNAEKIFSGNTNRYAKVMNKFPQPMTCRYIRIYPQSWHIYISMRLEFIRGSCYDDLF